MKKILAILLCAMLLMGIAGAETASDKIHLYFNPELSFDVQIPEGYTAENELVREYLLLRIKPEDPDGILYIMTVNEDDSMPDEINTLNDLSEEDLKLYAENCVEDDPDMAYEIRETGLGTKLVLVKNENDPYAFIFAYYHGYSINFQMYRQGESAAPITEEDINAALAFNTNFDFIFTEK